METAPQQTREGGIFSGCVGKTIKIGLFLLALYVIGHALILAIAMFVLSR